MTRRRIANAWPWGSLPVGCKKTRKAIMKLSHDLSARSARRCAPQIGGLARLLTAIALCFAAGCSTPPRTGVHFGESALAANDARCEGLRVKNPGEDSVYVILDGQRRHVPNRDVYYRLFDDPRMTRIITSVAFDDIPVGPPLSSDAEIVRRSPDSPDLYLLNDNMLRHIVNMDVFNRYGFNPDAVGLFSGPANIGPDLIGDRPPHRPGSVPGNG